ncbi:head-tail connector protein [Salinisphaera sp.]|uniref:head-tail connector protein n=1 Tax=Salinisphaera sp. TaxID=1914330 RepID=UPI000C433F77|nr:head-tail connector protein [Salinisphaera sp.]MAS10305.1 hypothetical protein [Salinisphaera sp.]|tara:strand:+ start:156 stop:476 length:321 start_codon:yes stop_codon:yes gene_type:complete
MPSLITADEAKEHLRLDDADTPWLNMAIPTVENAVIMWCGSESRLYNADDELHECVRLAVLVELARQYIQREGPQQKNQIDWFMNGYSLGPGATALLQPLRCPRIA